MNSRRQILERQIRRQEEWNVRMTVAKPNYKDRLLALAQFLKPMTRFELWATVALIAAAILMLRMFLAMGVEAGDYYSGAEYSAAVAAK